MPTVEPAPQPKRMSTRMTEPTLDPIPKPKPTPELPPDPEPKLHDAFAQPTPTNSAQIEHTETITPELPQTLDTRIPDPNPTEPSILHIFEDT